MPITIDKPIIQKFDVPGPRYTSYPTAPVWSEEVGEEIYIRQLKKFGQSDKTLSLYVHIPFCQTMCTYCACSVIIRRKDDKYADQYIDYLDKEIELIKKYIGTKKVIRQFHWGGGTPTFFNEDQIRRLFHKIQQEFEIDFNSEVAIEIDPRTITDSKIKTLKELGFNRISMGVQDFDVRVQESVNRIQPFELVKKHYDYCRELKFHSVNFDLIYGLPYQTKESFFDTVGRVLALKPDRIALYSFAYVPWLKKHQTKIDQATLPSNDEKVDIFLQSRSQFLDAGYQAIAMDHFALKEDELAKSFSNGKLYRNFMGYTVKPADEYIGLGLSSIGFLEKTFFQNHKHINDYYEALDHGRLPVERGKLLSADDQIRQFTINQLMCQFHLDKNEFQEKFNCDFDEYFAREKNHIRKCIEDGLIEVHNHDITVTELGRIFVRNICMGFDDYLIRKKTKAKFSKTV